MKVDRFWLVPILVPWKHKAKKHTLVTADLSHLELLEQYWTDVGDYRMRLWVHNCRKTILTPNCCLPYEAFEHFWYYTIILSSSNMSLFLLKKLEINFWSPYIGLTIPRESTLKIFLRSFILSCCKCKIYFYKSKCVQKGKKCGKANNSVHRKDSTYRASRTIFSFLLPHLIDKMRQDVLLLMWMDWKMILVITERLLYIS